MSNKHPVDVRWAALIFATLAVATGCALLTALGAPMRMPIMNAAALLVGLVGVALLALGRRYGTSALGDIVLLAASALLPLTALIGPPTSGVARWMVVGGLTIQPALIVVPWVTLGLALRPTPIRALSAIVTAIGLAMQPDPGMAVILLLGIAIFMAAPESRNASTWVALAAAVIGTRVAIARDVALPPVRFVERVIPDAFQAGPFAVLLALVAIALMIAPAVARDLRAPQLAFLAVWGTALTAALLGPYPTTILGFGGSGVLGFILSAGVLALWPRPLRRGQSGLG